MAPSQRAEQAGKGRRYLAILVVVAALAAGFLSFGPPRLYAKSSQPDFCASCHVMQSEYENWFYGAHRNFKCVECHLPNDSAPRFLAWKGYEGLRDVFFFYTGLVPENIRINPSGAAIVMENCRRCHSQMISLINEDRQCWTCHRRISHLTTGAQ